MNKQETVQVITLLAGNYDSIAKKDAMQKQMMVATWQECLGDLDYKIVLQAVKRVIITTSYPPTIHEIRKNAIKLIDSSTQRSAVEAWKEAYAMICRGSQITTEEFEKHSPEVKAFFRDVRQVKELGMSDINIVNTVTRGQFLKQYESIVSQENEQKLLPPKMQELKAQLVEKMSVKTLDER